MMIESPEQVAALSAEKLAVLELLLKKKGSDFNSFPLSFAQQRLWFLDQLEPGGSAYNIPTALRLSGHINVTALEQSLDEIIRRHESLRTSFALHANQAVQVIAAAVPLHLPIVDLSHLPFAEAEAEAERHATEEARRPFDLARGPLLRASLLRLAEQEHVALFTIHHIISDGWSSGLFIGELVALYEAYLAGAPSPLRELTIQYADYAVWQRGWLSGAVLDEQVAYWKKQLGGDVPVLELPTDYARPAVPSHRGARQTLSLSQPLTRALKELSRSQGVTLFMTLLAGWQLLLSRLSGQKEVVVGTPIAGRTRVEVEGLIGFFINTLVLRTDCSGEIGFRELLERVREVTLSAYAHQDVPFEKVVEEVQPARTLSRHPFFDVMFNFVNTPHTTLTLPGLSISHQEPLEPESKFAMILYVSEEDTGGLALQLVYQQELFSAERIQCLLAQYEHLLAQIVVAPEERLTRYSLVTERSRELLPDVLERLEEPDYQPITQLFVEQVERRPESPALEQGERRWTYAELFSCARTIAQRLVAEGVGPGEVVGLVGSRSFGMIGSLLGVLLGRGVILTIDESLPAARQRLMLKEAGARRLIMVGARTTEPGPQWFDELALETVLSVDGQHGTMADPPREGSVEDAAGVELPPVASEDAAYIFFTSGTSGIPKAVLGWHKGLSHFLTWQRERFELTPEDRCAQLTGLSFDVVLRDIFLPLTSGATLCLPEETDQWSGARVIDWLQRARISSLHTVPSLAQSWLRELEGDHRLPQLRLVFFAGEALLEGLVRRWREALGDGGQIINLYGPTETTLAKCYYQVGAEVGLSAANDGRLLPVGQALPQTQVLVLTVDGNLCGIGEPGEVVIRTPFRTLGYLNATAEQERRFVRNPHSEDASDLLYRSGDRGRYRIDGAVEVLGRLDEQVKIRGMRIEPGEIEAVLCEAEEIEQAVVVVREDGDGEKRLVAYVVRAAGSDGSVERLRRHVRERLPAYMEPWRVVELAEMPLTSNGKIDRRALPETDLSRPQLETAFTAPRNPVEEVMVGIWSEVLKVKRVGVNDNFFDLGGHSLMAIQIMSRVHLMLQVELPLRSLFEEPTIAGLALLVEQSQAAGKSIALGEIERVPRGNKSLDELMAQFEELSEDELKLMLEQS